MIDQILPLAHHAQGAVVEHHRDNGQMVVLYGGQLVAVHAKTAVPGGVDYHLVRVTHLGPDGRPQAEAHGAEAAGGEKLAGVVEVEVLDGPHLVLAHIGGHNGVLGGEAADGLQHLLGGESLALPGDGGLPQGEDVRLPIGVAVLGQALVEQSQHPLGRADDVVVGEDILVNLRPVDVDVDDSGLAGEGVGLEGHPVGEPAAHGDEQVALAAGHVAGPGAVHTDHAGGEGVPARGSRRRP